MQKSQLIESLSYLSADQFKKFGDFVHSSYHNTNEKLKSLYECIQSSYPDLTSQLLDKKKVYPKLYSNEKYNDDKLRAMMSLLLKLLKDFLVIEHLSQDEESYNKTLSTAYWQLGMEKQYEKSQEKQVKLLKQNEMQDISYFLHYHQLNESAYDFLVQKKDPSVGEVLKDLLGNLDAYYFAKRLKYSCEALNRKNIADEAFDIDTLLSIESFIKQNETVAEIALVAIYYQILQTLKDETNEQNFEKLVSLLEQHVHLFPASENKVMYGYAMNYCIKKINIGKSKYLNELFNLYKLLLRFDLIYEGKYISQWDYKNIVTVGLRLNELDWTESFIEDYKSKLTPSVRDNAYKYNLANLSYFKNDFEKTMELLREVEFTEMSYELSSKSLLLKSYYELEEFNALFALADTFKLFLRRSKRISNYQKTIYKNLIRYIVKLSKLKSKFQKVPKHVREAIENSSEIADKSWLLKKVEENKGFEMYGKSS